jgi:hypothetical protein
MPYPVSTAICTFAAFVCYFPRLFTQSDPFPIVYFQSSFTVITSAYPTYHCHADPREILGPSVHMALRPQPRHSHRIRRNLLSCQSRPYLQNDQNKHVDQSPLRHRRNLYVSNSSPLDFHFIPDHFDLMQHNLTDHCSRSHRLSRPHTRALLHRQPRRLHTPSRLPSPPARPLRRLALHGVFARRARGER